MAIGKHPADVGDYFEGVIRAPRTTAGPALNVVNWYQPTWAKSLNDIDVELGGSSPIVLPAIGGKQYVITTAKDGNVYLLDPTLGGWDGELYSSVTNKKTPARALSFRPKANQLQPTFSRPQEITTSTLSVREAPDLWLLVSISPVPRHA